MDITRIKPGISQSATWRWSNAHSGFPSIAKLNGRGFSTAGTYAPIIHVLGSRGQAHPQDTTSYESGFRKNPQFVNVRTPLSIPLNDRFYMLL